MLREIHEANYMSYVALILKKSGAGTPHRLGIVIHHDVLRQLIKQLDALFASQLAGRKNHGFLRWAGVL